MKKECYLCGEELRVDDNCDEVVCGCCLLAGSPLYRKDGIDYYTEDSLALILGEGKTDKEKAWEDAQGLRDRGLSIKTIAERLKVPRGAIRSYTIGKKKPKEGSN